MGAIHGAFFSLLPIPDIMGEWAPSMAYFFAPAANHGRMGAMNGALFAPTAP
jgi:hypothetical protein